MPAAVSPLAPSPRPLAQPPAHDHRVLGNRLDLFHQQPEGPGMVFWHPRGMALWRVIEDHIRARMRAAGYREVRTPQILARSLWADSGHLEKFGEHMFVLEAEGRPLALKPMSCPCHIQIFNKRIRSFRDLPMRYFEFGAVHRSEPSGALHGLFRTRGFVQDDAHVFCREDQVEAEVRRFCRLQTALYADFGFDAVEVRFSTRPELRAGDDAAWDRAEQSLEAAARAAGLDPIVQPGEGAFYGPKLEFHLRDRLGRAWQCGTVQLDFVLPERLGAEYQDAGNRIVRPVILHHAVLGSLERFIGMLLEHYDGHLPAWLAPEQLLVAAINKEAAPYARRLEEALLDAGLRVALDDGPDTLPRKIVDARERGIPLIAVIGKREAREKTVALRHRDGRQEVLPIAQAVAHIAGLAAAPAARAGRMLDCS